MRRGLLGSLILVAGTAVLFASCKKDELSGTGGDALCIDVKVKDFTSGRTRAGESGYTTTFTNGDQIGITVMRDGITVLENNIPYEFDGSAWNPLNTANAVHRYPQTGVTYLVYYPYNAMMDGKKSADEIFAAFTPKTDQSTYAAYTSSDLMTGTGSLSGAALSVTLDHALSLVEINLFAGASGVTLKVDEQQFTPYNISGATWRCIVKPEEGVILSGQYSLQGVLQSWQKTYADLTAGEYARINMINSFYIGDVTVNYAGGGKQTLQYDASTGNIPTLPGEMIQSIELPDAGGKTQLIGRSTSGTLTLKIHGSGDLLLRPADSEGYIPVGSYAELQLINTAMGALGGNYKQEADLDLMNEPWMPIGSDGSGFAGIFDGGGHTIANLKIDLTSADNVGLFGVLGGDNPQISDVHIISGSVKGGANVGGICGTSHYGDISACSNAASVEGTGDNVGGIAGMNDAGNVKACYNIGAISGSNSVGGLAGYSSGGVGACYNNGTVTGEDSVGGVAGMNDTGIVTACYNTAMVTGNNSVGGVVGLNTSDVIACYWQSGTAVAGVNNTTSITDPNYTGIATDVIEFATPPIAPDDTTYPQWGIGDGGDVTELWKNYDGNGGLPQLWWEN